MVALQYVRYEANVRPNKIWFHYLFEEFLYDNISQLVCIGMGGSHLLTKVDWDGWSQKSQNNDDDIYEMPNNF